MEQLRYFFHPDHASTELSTSLGSSSWITDGSGNSIQHLHYLPFGEDWVDQRNSSWNAPYTFSGKEKDAETGYGYFGARYYDSGLSIWLSVDPMADNTPFATPYAYCINNPIILHDPDGQDWFVNELTGDIYYDEELKKGSESFVADGKNIKWLGENDMFGQSASSAILGNQDIGTIWNWGFKEKMGKAEFKGKDATEFADRMGYKQVPTQGIVYQKSNPQSIGLATDDGRSYDIGCIAIVGVEKVGYVPKNYNYFDAHPTGKGVSKSTNLIFNMMTESVNSYSFEYRERSTARGIGQALQVISTGKIGPNMSGPCIPNSDLINLFKKTKQ